VHREYLLRDDGGDRHAIEAVCEYPPQLDTLVHKQIESLVRKKTGRVEDLLRACQ
jgi:hypothetical protein